jgi:hypothetical protein
MAVTFAAPLEIQNGALFTASQACESRQATGTDFSVAQVTADRRWLDVELHDSLTSLPLV